MILSWLFIINLTPEKLRNHTKAQYTGKPGPHEFSFSCSCFYRLLPPFVLPLIYLSRGWEREVNLLVGLLVNSVISFSINISCTWVGADINPIFGGLNWVDGFSGLKWIWICDFFLRQWFRGIVMKLSWKCV